MRRRLIASIVCSFSLTGCGANIDDLVLYTNQVKANTQVSVEEYPEFKPLPSVSYEASNIRSPFLRSNEERAVAQAIDTPNCEQPDHQRKKQPLESYGIDGLQMSGVFTNNGRQYALVKANDGTLHKVTVGSYLGLFHGQVTRITDTEIIIEEMLPDGAGCWKSKQASLTMASMVGENDNV